MLVKNALKWDTKLCIGLILLCHLFDSACFSQFGQNKSSEYSSSHSIFLSQSYQKFDNFSCLNWSLRKNNLSISSAFGVGINRTFYQRRFFPQFQIGIGYRVVSLNKASIFPELTLFLSTFSTIERHYFSSLHFGYLFQYGDRIYFLHRLNAGMLNEKFKNSLGNFTTANTINWQFLIGIGYAFN